mmetsp:Transcript_18002/g.44978  ORF Transcript_18002/g.44978 Transcript_18002/m.44978 type:complete len:822 (+) Transcript_18002:302-2767(+)|eukprot:CAMPEP_0178999804 /NCGR_PEP_ID=MMETSP0795-20121207/10295_1 /TAXON_ID=88552 /ORGANISM="Amoebophrya sp., Strain Ameob2" /LENGTH=821 /DNA_ID=CAMNT_0020692681 /DNA_START=259 /DNA_END=2724 /DNA_ORIENTATION=-
MSALTSCCPICRKGGHSGWLCCGCAQSAISEQQLPPHVREDFLFQKKQFAELALSKRQKARAAPFRPLAEQIGRVKQLREEVRALKEQRLVELRAEIAEKRKTVAEKLILYEKNEYYAGKLGVGLGAARELFAAADVDASRRPCDEDGRIDRSTSNERRDEERGTSADSAEKAARVAIAGGRDSQLPVEILRKSAFSGFPGGSSDQASIPQVLQLTSASGAPSARAGAIRHEQTVEKAFRELQTEAALLQNLRRRKLLEAVNMFPLKKISMRSGSSSARSPSNYLVTLAEVHQLEFRGEQVLKMAHVTQLHEAFLYLYTILSVFGGYLDFSFPFPLQVVQQVGGSSGSGGASTASSTAAVAPVVGCARYGVRTTHVGNNNSTHYDAPADYGADHLTALGGSRGRSADNFDDPEVMAAAGEKNRARQLTSAALAQGSVLLRKGSLLLQQGVKGALDESGTFHEKLVKPYPVVGKVLSKLGSAIGETGAEEREREGSAAGGARSARGGGHEGEAVVGARSSTKEGAVGGENAIKSEMNSTAVGGSGRKASASSSSSALAVQRFSLASHRVVTREFVAALTLLRENLRALAESQGVQFLDIEASVIPTGGGGGFRRGTVASASSSSRRGKAGAGQPDGGRAGSGRASGKAETASTHEEDGPAAAEGTLLAKSTNRGYQFLRNLLSRSSSQTDEAGENSADGPAHGGSGKKKSSGQGERNESAGGTARRNKRRPVDLDAPVEADAPLLIILMQIINGRHLGCLLPPVPHTDSEGEDDEDVTDEEPPKKSVISSRERTTAASASLGGGRKGPPPDSGSASTDWTLI